MDVYGVIKRVVERGGMAMAIGGLDTGKSTFCRMLAEVAVRSGRKVAYLDADVGQSTVGPPATIGLKFIATDEDLEPEHLSRADAMYFVGATSPNNHMLPMVVGMTKLAVLARAEGVDVIVVDTTGFIDGTKGQVLKLHKVEVLEPDFVVGFHRGGELAPILGAIRRALPPEVDEVDVDANIRPTTLDERVARRQARLRAEFEGPIHRWKVKPSVLVPAIPPDVDAALLDGFLVGMEDGKGHCVGLGVLEHTPEGLKMVSSLAEGARALRLGSLRVSSDFRTTAVDLRDIFITD
jgi:polynucleotide 5'-kinase involved in rRNA processing